MTDDTRRRLSLWRQVGLSLGVTAGVWLALSWPLPRYVCRGIPASAHRAPADVQRMIPGDHLQFLYYCWLAGDMAAGHTPWGYNLYEFNTGNDRDRFEPDTYYLPFSLLYAGAAAVGGRAFGWNLAGFLSLWITYWLTWCLARRWTRSAWLAGVAALVGIALPFRWINLFGGSPAGFALAWVPAILLGTDLAAREDRPAGGWLAGLAILLAAWGDRHVFFFSVLAVPGWAVLALAARPDFAWRRSAAYARTALALAPIALGAGLALAFPLLMNAVHRAVIGTVPAAHAIGPRSLREVLIYSPDWRGFFGASTLAASDAIYLGAGLLAALAAGWLALLAAAWRRARSAAAGVSDTPGVDSFVRTLLIVALLGSALATVMLLSLGARAPDSARLFAAARALIPPYAMVRQPAKIFSLMPTLLAVASALALTGLSALLPARGAPGLLGILFAAVLLGASAPRVRPTISILESAQAAYAATAEDAAAAGRVPRALVLPLWPGDSHYASIYQYCASLYRVRMVNGYNPFVRAGYFENVFRRFESVNQGGLDDAQLAALAGMGVDYVLLHENLFPEKVSPFPVTMTLARLLAHPRLDLLRQDGSVWAFRIRPPAGESPRQPAPAPGVQALIAQATALAFPARRFEMEKTTAEGHVTVKVAPAAGGRACVALAAPGDGLRTAPLRVAGASNLQWLVRVRGQGTLRVTPEIETAPTAPPPAPVSVRSAAWTWVAVPIPPFRGFDTLRLATRLESGAVDLDMSLLAAGAWRPPGVRQLLTLPAPLFFHAGHIEPETGTVLLRRDHDAQGIAFYGPKLPLEPGTYELDLAFASPAPAGTPLAVARLEPGDDPARGVAVPVVAGQPARGRWRQPESLPFTLVVVYGGVADLRLRTVTITRLK